jgi:hypothetical protein
MVRRLFTVEDVVAIKERRVVLFPGIVPEGDERFRIGDAIELRFADGDSRRVSIADFGLTTPNPHDTVVVVLRNEEKDDIPVGTEVWSID